MHNIMLNKSMFKTTACSSPGMNSSSVWETPPTHTPAPPPLQPSTLVGMLLSNDKRMVITNEGHNPTSTIHGTSESRHNLQNQSQPMKAYTAVQQVKRRRWWKPQQDFSTRCLDVRGNFTGPLAVQFYCTPCSSQRNNKVETQTKWGGAGLFFFFLCLFVLLSPHPQSSVFSPPPPFLWLPTSPSSSFPPPFPLLQVKSDITDFLLE